MDRKDDITNKSENLFENNGYFIFLYKKTEKLVAAIHLVTNLIKDEEGIKWQLRSKSLELLSDILALYHSHLSNKTHGKKVQGLFTEILSLFDIAFISNIISEMNITILKREFLSLLDHVERQGFGASSTQPLILSEDFFDVGYPHLDSGSVPESSIVSGKVQNKLGEEGGYSKGHHKGQNNKTLNMSDKTGSQNSLKYKVGKGESGIKDKNTDRRFVIVNLLKTSKNIGVNDVSAVIKDCSEKTIQRELISMVKEGVLKKEGERRWSRYSLV